jgi:hypothetical protein
VVNRKQMSVYLRSWHTDLLSKMANKVNLNIHTYISIYIYAMKKIWVESNKGSLHHYTHRGFRNSRKIYQSILQSKFVTATDYFTYVTLYVGQLGRRNPKDRATAGQ